MQLSAMLSTLLFCGCLSCLLIIINCQPTVDLSSLDSCNDDDNFKHLSSQLAEVRDKVEDISTHLKTKAASSISLIDDNKRHLVSALTDRCVPLLIQQNLDGSDFFNRSWAEFKVGFSDTRGNYWLGNDLLSQLTTGGRYKLRFDLRSRVRGWYYAEYTSFVVMDENSNYTLRVFGYSGNAGRDSFSYSSGRMFTTYDRDNDPWMNAAAKNNCAVHNGGGFWYGECAACEVNTVIGMGGDFSWEGLPGGDALSSSRMWLHCH